MKRRERSNLGAGLLWISPWLIGFVLFFGVPMGMSLYYSFTDYPLIEAPLYVGGKNYAELFRDPIFWKVMRNTVVYAGVSIPLGTVIALAVAGLLNTKVRGMVFFRAAVYVPQVVPIVASAMVWMWLFNAEWGLINQLLKSAGVNGADLPNWLGDRGLAMWALVIMNLWVIGQPVVIYLAALQDVPKQLYEAGELDGMGPVRRFWHIALPAISPVVLFNVVYLTISCWQVFAIPYIMTEGGPDRATYFYSHYLYDNAFLFQRMGYASAMAWVQFVIILGLTAFMFAASRRLVQQGVR